ncbi:MAG: DUF481 domain-containing protein [Candidatus Latescibacteria bacterium]|nr:DUF481 domain-containing protein [Candidatus Latescibacterota bacterium]
MKSRWLGVLVLCFWAMPVLGQIDIESMRQDGARGFFGSVEVDLTLRAGNVELFEFGPELSINYGRAKDTFIFIGSGDAGWEGNERFSNEALGHMRYVRALTTRLQGEVFAQLNYDKSRRLDFRTIGGGGLRWALLAPGESSFWLGSSLMFEHERNEVAPGDDHPERTSVGRWSNYLSADIGLSKTARLTSTAYVQPDLQSFGDLRVLVDGALKVSITEALALSTSISFSHDSEPLAAVDGSDFRLSTGLGLEW